jgi:C-terminal processing protease CtpA/Prc
VYKPDKKNFFDGQVYILCSGGTVSAAAKFVNTSKNYSNAIIIGEETGGCYIGGSAGNSAILTLPNSKIQLIIALAFFKPPWFSYDKRGRGIIPDYKVEQSLHGDPVMEFTKKLIKEK